MSNGPVRGKEANKDKLEDDSKRHASPGDGVLDSDIVLKAPRPLKMLFKLSYSAVHLTFSSPAGFI